MRSLDINTQALSISGFLQKNFSLLAASLKGYHNGTTKGARATDREPAFYVEACEIAGIFVSGIQRILECERDGKKHQWVPIPLTEEWLLKFGFEIETKYSHSMGYEKNYKVYRKDLFTYNGIQAVWWFDNKVLRIQPEYAHQLQNLFYALCGHELKIQNI